MFTNLLSFIFLSFLCIHYAFATSQLDNNDSDFNPMDIINDVLTDPMEQLVDISNITSETTEETKTSNNSFNQSYTDTQIHSAVTNMTSYIDSKIANLTSLFLKLNNTINEQQITLKSIPPSENLSKDMLGLSNIQQLDITNSLLFVLVIFIVLISGFFMFIILKILRVRGLF